MADHADGTRRRTRAAELQERLAIRAASLMRRFEGSVNEPQWIRGQRVKIPLVLGLRCRVSEPWMLDVLERVLPLRSGAFVDVGVNLGQTLIKLRALDEARPYVGFEPNPTCIVYLNELVRANGYASCTLVPVALSTESEVQRLQLFSARSADASASLIPDFRQGQQVVKTLLVSVARFAQVRPLLPIERIGVVKIDVEGAELEVMRSLRAEIERDRPVILIEVLPAYSTEQVDRVARQAELGAMLQELDYAISRVRKTRAGQYDGLTPLDRFDIHADLTLCDYVLTPRELTQRLITQAT